jgi:hypothetical protein
MLSPHRRFGDMSSDVRRSRNFRDQKLMVVEVVLAVVVVGCGRVVVVWRGLVVDGVVGGGVTGGAGRGAVAVADWIRMVVGGATGPAIVTTVVVGVASGSPECGAGCAARAGLLCTTVARRRVTTRCAAERGRAAGFDAPLIVSTPRSATNKTRIAAATTSHRRRRAGSSSSGGNPSLSHAASDAGRCAAIRNRPSADNASARPGLTNGAAANAAHRAVCALADRHDAHSSMCRPRRLRINGVSDPSHPSRIEPSDSHFWRFARATSSTVTARSS